MVFPRKYSQMKSSTQILLTTKTYLFLKPTVIHHIGPRDVTLGNHVTVAQQKVNKSEKTQTCIFQNHKLEVHIKIWLRQVRYFHEWFHPENNLLLAECNTIKLDGPSLNHIDHVFSTNVPK